MNTLPRTIALCCIAAAASCSKKAAPAPPQAAAATIATGTYRVVEDQGSDNGDTAYYVRTPTACDTSARFAFGSRTLTLTGSCVSATAYEWTYDPSTSVLTYVDGQGGTGTVKIEDLTATGLVWDAIATGQDNERLTLEIVK